MNIHNAQPADAQESKENMTFARLTVVLFKRTNSPSPKLTKNANESMNPMRVNDKPTNESYPLFEILTYNQCSMSSPESLGIHYCFSYFLVNWLISYII